MVYKIKKITKQYTVDFGGQVEAYIEVDNTGEINIFGAINWEGSEINKDRIKVEKVKRL